MAISSLLVRSQLLWSTLVWSPLVCSLLVWSLLLCGLWAGFPGRLQAQATAAAPAVMSPAATAQGAIPAETPMAAELDRHIPLKLGEPVRAALLYPVYAGDTEVLPARAVLEGSIVRLTPAPAKRHRAMLKGDFTPFRTPTVQFTSVVLADGRRVPISVGAATGGAPFLSIAPPPPATGGLVHRSFDRAKALVRSQLEVFTAPGLGDRLLQTFYFALPYHPQRLEKATAWSFETAEPFALAAGETPLTVPEPKPAKDHAALRPAVAQRQDGPPTWVLKAFLDESLDSATTPVGTPIHATVAQPIWNADHTVAVPVGSVLTGTVVSVKPARTWGRAGTLRFAFNKLTLPGAEAHSVQATLTGVDAQGQLALDSEGQVKPQSPSIVMPLVLALLAAHTFDEDPGGSGAGQFGRDGAGANGFGLVGVVVGLAAQSASVAAGIGYYGAALTVYDRFLTRGKQVTFAKNTRLNIQTTARRSEPMQSSTDRNESRRPEALKPEH